MNTLKSLVTAVALTFILAVAAEGAAPQCGPGHTETPPCPSAQATSQEPAVLPGETQTSPEVQSGEIVSLVEFALHALLLA